MSALVTRDGLVANDPWRFLTADEPAQDDADIVVPFARLRDDAAVLQRTGRLGVAIEPGDPVEDIA